MNLHHRFNETNLDPCVTKAVLDSGPLSLRQGISDDVDEEALLNAFRRVISHNELEGQLGPGRPWQSANKERNVGKYPRSHDSMLAINEKARLDLILNLPTDLG